MQGATTTVTVTVRVSTRAGTAAQPSREFSTTRSEEPRDGNPPPEEEQLPVGALFRRFDVLPTFTLHSAGKVAGGFWRQYQLKATGLTCEINETFSSDVFSMLSDAPQEPPRLPSSDFAF